ncbi:MAG: hypothetical protein ACRDMX_07535 [Solirubrobacteraceae bacterium]
MTDGARAVPPAQRHRPPLFAQRSRAAQVLIAIVIPGLIGALAGVLLGISSIAYAAIGLLAAIGAFLSGFEHAGAWSAADRGFVAGAGYGVGLLIAHGLAGTHATVALGSFPPALIIVTAIVGALLAAAGASGSGERIAGESAPVEISPPER